MVEISNLHRQIAHTETSASEAQSKVDSLVQTLAERNSVITYEKYKMGITQQNAVDIISQFDVILDCTDNVETRYIINDACVVAGKPLVSGAAIAAEGQLSVYNYKSRVKREFGPCYRCIFPQAPVLSECRRCDESGVLGPVPGMIGVLQALEAMKVLGEFGCVMSQKMLIFDGLTMRSHVVKLRSKNSSCICHSWLPKDLLSYDYKSFTGQMSQGTCENLEILPLHRRLEATDLKNMFDSERLRVTVVDVRPKREYDMVRLVPSLNIPIDKLRDSENIVKIKNAQNNDNDESELVILCRRGNDSQRAVQMLDSVGVGSKDVRGGLVAWQKFVDKGFPLY